MNTLITRSALLAPSLRQDWYAIPLRLIIGYGFLEHGYAKLLRGVDAFPQILAAMHMPAPHLLGWMMIAVEMAGGLAVILGFFIPLASLPMIIVLLVATFTVHLPKRRFPQLLEVEAGESLSLNEPLQPPWADSGPPDRPALVPALHGRHAARRRRCCF